MPPTVHANSPTLTKRTAIELGSENWPIARTIVEKHTGQMAYRLRELTVLSPAPRIGVTMSILEEKIEKQHLFDHRRMPRLQPTA